MVLEMQKPHVVVDKLEDSYGRFIVEPLERGLGHTLGNSMRRVLLSSIPGAAITSVRIEGVVHEFTAIEGVKEDTMDIILNLKSVILKIDGEGSYALTLDVTGPKTVTAGDIQVPAEVEIINPDLKICTLNGKGRLKAEMAARAKIELRRGRQLIIFPEGTRRPPGAAPRYKYGVAHLYGETGVPCLPVALNSGLFWARRSLIRRPGTVLVEILDPIPPGLDPQAFLERLQSVIEAATGRLIAEGERDSDRRATLAASKRAV